MSVCQNPDPSLGYGGTVWDAALVLCAFLESNEGFKLIHNSACVELGSGTGIVAIAAEALGASSSIATDKDICIPFIRQNIGLNPNCSTRAVPLNWENAATEASPLTSNCDWVLCADCVYDSADVGHLVNTIIALNPKRGVIVSNERRTGPVNLEAEKEFIRAMYKTVGLKGKAVHPEVIRSDWRCDDIHVVVFEREEKCNVRE